jgi:hypothetical protein
MAAGDKTDGKTFLASMMGMSVYGCEVTLNGTTAVTVKTPMSKIVNVQVTFAEEPANGTTSELFASTSGGTITLDCSAACGTKTASVLAWGYM